MSLVWSDEGTDISDTFKSGADLDQKFTLLNNTIIIILVLIITEMIIINSK